ncbi:fimbrial protein [Entomohabitans teleogrylli]|uniref:fimbrial protein n=1 Tax=Entomohabitans teleogrylli TaxID=1384589 RepID=UPI00073D3B96|nr:type 1 fimbrial protein [Entomohabitans teleogrylli]
MGSRIAGSILFLMFPSFAGADALTESQGTRAKLHFQGTLYESPCTLVFESGEQIVALGKTDSRYSVLEVPDSLVIHLSNCARREIPRPENTSMPPLLREGDSLVSITFSGDSLPQAPGLFTVWPRNSGLGLKIIEPPQASPLAAIRAPAQEQDGSWLRYDIQVVHPGDSTGYRGPIESMVTFNLKYY